MDTPFRVTWERLDLPDLRAFLAEGPDESLTWEAKGPDVRTEHVRRAVCAFANSELGGFLILGAARAGPTAPWTVGGWTPKTEPALWVEDCLANGGVRPRPSIDIRAWSIGDGPERVAVVAIRPVAVPPALTAAGEVLQRVSGSSQRVTDPVTLRELFTRGREAEHRAAKLVEDGIKRLWPNDAQGRRSVYAVCLATPALPDDISLRLFREAIGLRLGTRSRGGSAGRRSTLGSTDKASGTSKTPSSG